MRRPRAGARRRTRRSIAHARAVAVVPCPRDEQRDELGHQLLVCRRHAGHRGIEPEGRENHSRFPSNHRFPRTRRPAPPAGRLASKDSRRKRLFGARGPRDHVRGRGPRGARQRRANTAPNAPRGIRRSGGSTSGWLARASASARAREMPAQDDEQARAARLPLVDASRCTRQERLRRARLRPGNLATVRSRKRRAGVSMVHGGEA
jgi:hypothetical protein